MKTALVTGASRGIGAAVATEFAKNGYNVVINYLNSVEAAHSLERYLCEELRVQTLAVRADVAEEAQVLELFARARERFGQVDVLVNNAAVAGAALLTDMTAAEWDAMFGTNVRGVFLCCREALRGMVSNKQGRIINISSIWGMVGASCEVCYSATKSAVIGVTKALAKEVGPCGITVNCVAPGVIYTDMNAALTDADIAELADQTPLMRLGTAREIADAVMYLASDAAGFMTGQVLSPNGGLVI